MPLHPEVEAMRARKAREGTAPLYTLSLAEARAADLADIQAASGTGEPVAAVADRTIPGPGGRLRIRIYEPDHGRGRPALVYFFGGGWTLGNLETCDAICRALTNASGCVTVSVEYRLAPENPFPAAVEDCRAGVAWVAGHAAQLGIDPDRLAVGGDSAGGNLAAAVSLLARDGGGPALRHQLLVYPNTDCAWDPQALRAHEDPLLFNRFSVQWYWGHYLAEEKDGLSALASPLRAESLAGLPDATVITAEYDPLRDQGEAYARRLSESGVAVELRRYDGMAHGFFAMFGAFTLGREAIDYAAARLAAGLA
ncbi:MAG TPA: alpha/beta hydrolase [Actinocrinis sp.]|uniref:alpha/beta hydrolase n=1 Tax=Actinocrinis sp. TaxID=1920516 RepID=UPI002DDDB95C|nr:alpha/beta hydrolase [Actinocrinis sp.]HEV2343400.1 alpha/beta hydrolase [Actinocrinis sp.]